MSDELIKVREPIQKTFDPQVHFHHCMFVIHHISSAFLGCDMTMSTTPSSNMLQPPTQATPTQGSPTSTPAQVFDGPITRSRAKKLQQEVHQEG